MNKDKPLKFFDLLKKSNLDPSFDNNVPIKWVCYRGHTEIVKYLLNDHRVDPSVGSNHLIWCAYDNKYKEIVNLLLNDERVRSELTDSEINKYTKYTSK